MKKGEGQQRRDCVRGVNSRMPVKHSLARTIEVLGWKSVPIWATYAHSLKSLATTRVCMYATFMEIRGFEVYKLAVSSVLLLHSQKYRWTFQIRGVVMNRVKWHFLRQFLNSNLRWFFSTFTRFVLLEWSSKFSLRRALCAFAGRGNGHSLSVMSETNSRVISLTSRRGDGCPEGLSFCANRVAGVAPTRTPP